ncbi:MAG: amidohydrolase family protein [Bacteroidota bacterium]
MWPARTLPIVAKFVFAPLLVLFTLLLSNFFNQQVYAQTADLLITNVALFDGQDIRYTVDVSVSDGQIAQILEHPSGIEAKQQIDGSEQLLIPGLINAHVHAWFPDHLKEAARSGILSMLDMHGSVFSLELLRKLRDSTQYATYYGAGGGMTVPEGHGTQFGMPTPVVNRNTSPTEFVNERAEEGVDYIKILREPSMATLTEAQIREGVAAAHELDLLAVAHVSRVEDASMLTRSGIDGLVHIWYDQSITEERLDSLVEADIFVVPTCLTNMLFYDYAYREELPRAYMDSTQLLREIGRLHQAGIPILAGTDPPNLGINYGSDLYRELELLVMAGLTPVEAIRAATGAISDAFGLEDAGYLGPGKYADMILLPVAVLEDISLIREPGYIWKRGISIKTR